MFLRDLLIVFAGAGVVVYLFQRLRLPSIVGLLATGVLVGPTGLGLVGETEQVRLLAEIGVVVLLLMALHCRPPSHSLRSLSVGVTIRGVGIHSASLHRRQLPTETK